MEWLTKDNMAKQQVERRRRNEEKTQKETACSIFDKDKKLTASTLWKSGHCCLDADVLSEVRCRNEEKTQKEMAAMAKFARSSQTTDSYLIDPKPQEGGAALYLDSLKEQQPAESEANNEMSLGGLEGVRR